MAPQNIGNQNYKKNPSNVTKANFWTLKKILVCCFVAIKNSTNHTFIPNYK